MEENIRAFAGIPAFALSRKISKNNAETEASHAATGTLIGPFAKMGKCKVVFAIEVAEDYIAVGTLVEFKLGV